jgi:hypothetical protein
MTPHSCKKARLPDPSHAKGRPFLRPRVHRTTMRPIYHSPLHLSRIPPSSTHSQAKLPFFIAYALHRTKLHQAVTFGALVLLQRLKARFPTARGSSGHRWFISAFMIASKVICDDTYSNKSWSSQIQEVCQYLRRRVTDDDFFFISKKGDSSPPLCLAHLLQLRQHDCPCCLLELAPPGPLFNNTLLG